MASDSGNSVPQDKACGMHHKRMCWLSAALLPKPSLPYCRKEMRQGTYRFSWTSFVSTLPRLTLLSLHTTTQPVTASCLLESHSIRSHVSTTHMLRSNSAQKED